MKTRARARAMWAVLVCGWAISCIAQDEIRNVKASPKAFIQTSRVADLARVQEPAAVIALNILDHSEHQGEIDDEDLAVLDRFTEVRTLILGCPLLTDVGLRKIAKMPNVECLVIYGGDITDAGLQQLGDMPNLRVLGLYDIAVTDDDIETLKGKLKNVYIERWSGEDGVVFDPNGCFNPKLLMPPFQLPRDASR